MNTEAMVISEMLMMEDSQANKDTTNLQWLSG